MDSESTRAAPTPAPSLGPELPARSREKRTGNTGLWLQRRRGGCSPWKSPRPAPWFSPVLGPGAAALAGAQGSGWGPGPRRAAAWGRQGWGNRPARRAAPGRRPAGGGPVERRGRAGRAGAAEAVPLPPAGTMARGGAGAAGADCVRGAPPEFRLVVPRPKSRTVAGGRGADLAGSSGVLRGSGAAPRLAVCCAGREFPLQAAVSGLGCGRRLFGPRPSTFRSAVSLWCA